MALPQGGNTQWPPEGWSAIYNGYQEHSAWYSGDPEQLASVYGGMLETMTRRSRFKFWGRGKKGTEHQARSQLHVPLAGDIAATSSALLFSEAPEFLIPDAHEENAPADAKAAQSRLDEIVNEGGIIDRLSEAAETSAALGGVFIKPDWDRAVADVPVLSVVQADNAVPEFRYGMLQAVTLWRVVEGAERDRIYRHLERHTTNATGSGVIEHGLYRGSREQLGERIALAGSPDTEGLQDVLILPFPGLGIRYVANLRPNRKHRGSPLGQSDYAGAEGLLDALDEVFTSWMRDIRLAKARIVVPEEYLERKGDSMAFDLDREVYAAMEMDPTGGPDITPVQFAIRVDEHERTALTYIERIITHAGYSPQTFGLHIEGRAESGTALRIRERKTLTTQQRKRRYWEPALEDVLEMLLSIDRAVFNPTTPVFRPQVNMADSVADDPTEVAATIELLNRAASISLYEKVRMRHPEWKKPQIDEEVARLEAEQGQAVEDPFQIGIV